MARTSARFVQLMDPVLEGHVIHTPRLTPQAEDNLWLVSSVGHCGAVLLRSFPASPTASFIVITPIIPSLALSCLLLLPFLSRTLTTHIQISILSSRGFPFCQSFFYSPRFRHACYHGGDPLPRHEDRHCRSSRSPFRRRSLWTYCQGD